MTFCVLVACASSPGREYIYLYKDMPTLSVALPVIISTILLLLESRVLAQKLILLSKGAMADNRQLLLYTWILDGGGIQKTTITAGGELIPYVIFNYFSSYNITRCGAVKNITANN